MISYRRHAGCQSRQWVLICLLDFVGYGARTNECFTCFCTSLCQERDGSRNIRLFECFAAFSTFKVQRFRWLVVWLSRRGNLESIGSRRRYSHYELLWLYSVTRPAAAVADHVGSVGLLTACCLRNTCGDQLISSLLPGDDKLFVGRYCGCRLECYHPPPSPPRPPEHYSKPNGRNLNFVFLQPWSR